MPDRVTSEPVIFLDKAALSDATQARQFAHEETTTIDWMIDPVGLGLQARSVELEVYARIWAVSRNGVGVYCEPQGKLAERLYTNRQTVNGALRSLLARDLIRIVGVVDGNKTGVRAYVVNSQMASAAVLALEAKWRKGAEDAMAQPAVIGHVTEIPPHVYLAGEPNGGPTAPAVAKPEPFPEGFEELMDAYPKSTTTRYVRAAKESYQALLDEGHSPKEIRDALEAYVGEHREKNGGVINKQYLKSFNNFLAQGSGARAYMSAGKAPKAGDSAETKLRFAKARSGGKTFWIASLGHEALELGLPEDASEEELRAAFESEMSARELAKWVS